MARAGTARVLRWLLLALGTAAVLVAVVAGLGREVTSEQLTVLLPFAAVAGAAALLGPGGAAADRLVARLVRSQRVTPYAALADATRRIQAGSPEEVLPGLAQALAAGTGARRASVWLAVEDRLVESATSPPRPAGPPETADGLGALLARPDTDHAVPVLEEAGVPAALTLSTPGPVTAADRRLVRDVARGAGLLLRVAALNAELAGRVRRADALAEELRRSGGRLADARDAERRRLIGELSHATGEPLAALRRLLLTARAGLDAGDGGAEAALDEARTRLDDLLDSFRAIARGVYPSVLRDQGLVAALDEVAADLPRAVRIDGGSGPRMPWEVESGLYFATVSLLRELAARPGGPPVEVHLQRSAGRIGALLTDPAPPSGTDGLRTLLADDADRLQALGGGLELREEEDGGPPGRLTARAWLPDRLAPLVEAAAAPGVAER